MPVRPLQLDDRTFEQIKKAALERIRVTCPDWTDFNDSDPGIALVDLFAWFTETMLVQMNHLPQLHHLELLRLLDLSPSPARPASAVVSFGFPEATPPEHLPETVPRHAASLPISVDDRGPPIKFETEEALPLLRAPLSALRHDGTIDLLLANNTPGERFQPFGKDGSQGARLVLGFRAAERYQARQVFPEVFGVHVRLGRTSPIPSERVPPLRWSAILADDEEEPLEVVEDRTEKFTKDGYVKLRRPRRAGPHPRFDFSPAFWITCRVASRAYPTGAAPVLERIDTNTVDAVARWTVRNETLAQSSGQADQRLRLAHYPVETTTDGGLQLEIGGEPWRQVDDLYSIKTPEKVFQLDAGRGEIRFGNGRNGHIPFVDKSIVATYYRAGGGRRTNVPAGAIMIMPITSGVVTGTNHYRAEGGLDAQTEEDLRLRAPQVLRARDRVLTAADYEEIACKQGGMAQARALPLRNPRFPHEVVAGSVTVVVVPPSENDERPVATDSQIAMVEKELSMRRPLGVELHVIRAAVRRVRVDAWVVFSPQTDQAKAEGEAARALDEFLRPRQRAIGKALRPSQLVMELQSLAGIAAVTVIQVSIDGEPEPVTLQTIEVPLDQTEVVWGAGGHRIIDAEARVRQ